ncbi:hypothetical protein [Maribacter dokdonensis]|uniref:hypothetical protein n=1 Tax=Maribacter dokdonensis TaxID=320912 RepID=UPI002734CE2F|nr:hypothetical protein [Maribacter dokdonensis]MDP2525788.1 hypothetical protein [Maribacter dokdonensis]
MKLYQFLTLFFLTLGIYAQMPEKISYQAIVRNTDGEILGNSTIGIKISILQQTTNGQEVYQESHLPLTNENGLMTLQIGTGTVLKGTFTDIDWSNGPFFLETQMDLNGGVNYSISGVTELLSVPYALYAKTAGNITTGNDYLKKSQIISFETDRDINESDILNTLECINSATLRITSNFDLMKVGDYINLEAHNGAVLNIQALEGVQLNYQLNGNATFISNKGNVRFGLLRKLAANSYIISGQ